MKESKTVIVGRLLAAGTLIAGCAKEVFPTQTVTVDGNQTTSGEAIESLPTPEVRVTQVKTVKPEPIATVEIIETQEVFRGSQDNTFLAVPGVPEGFGGTGKITEFFNNQEIQDKLNDQGYAPVVDAERVLSRTQIQDGSKVCISNLPDTLYNPDVSSEGDTRIASESGIVSYGDPDTSEARTKTIGVVSTSGIPDEWRCVNAVVTDESNPAGLGALRTLIIDNEGNIKAEVPAAFSGDDDVEIRWENSGPALYVNGEVVDPTYREGVELPVVEQGPPDLGVEGLTQGEIVNGLGEQQYVKYFDSEGLVQKVYDTESGEVLYAGESVWNATDKETREEVKFSALVVTSKGTEENDGHFVINHQTQEEIARAYAAVAAINYFDQSNKGGPLRTSADDMPDSRQHQMVEDLVDKFVSEIVAERQEGNTLKVGMWQTMGTADPTNLVIRLNYDPEAKGQMMNLDFGRHIDRTINRINDFGNLVIDTKNSSFDEPTEYYSEAGSQYVVSYPLNGWIFHDISIMLIKSDEVAGRARRDLLEYNADLYYSVLKFAVKDDENIEYRPVGSGYARLKDGKVRAVSGDWFGGVFIASE